MTPEWDVVVIGAGGSQAQAMLVGAARDQDLSRWIAVDRAWRTDTAGVVDQLGMRREVVDIFDEPQKLDVLVSSAKLVANFAGPYYRTGGAVLESAIRGGTDYLDICDDADAVLGLLGYDQAAKDAGVTALVGMGSSPGTTNILIRAAVDSLGPVASVDIYWTVDIGDMTPAAARHFWHCFNLIDLDGTSHPVPTWDALDRATIAFPGSVGTREVVRLAHPEPITVTRFLPVASSRNYGSITPADAMIISWSLAYSVDPQRHQSGEDLATLTEKAVDVFLAYQKSRPAGDRIGSGLIIDVHTDGNGIRYASGAQTEMAEATGIPAAAGVLLMLEGKSPGPGVIPPESLSPADFFASLPRVSRGGGGLATYRLEDGVQTDRIRLRDLIAGPSTVGA